MPTPELSDAASPFPQGESTRPPGEMTNPKLGATLRADYEALRNDVQQATDLATDFQAQLAGKSNELAHLKRVFEKTTEDLIQLQASITELREERHRLANEAMRATALERRVNVITADRDRLHGELQILKQSATGSSEETARRLRDRDAQVAQLSTEVESLRQRLAFVARNPTAPPQAPLPRGVAPEIKAAVAAMADHFEELMRLVYPESATSPAPAAAVRPTAPTAKPAPDGDDFIDISFSA